ncbi:MAG: hypothetical protein N2235_25305, partial [Fischerella sp.]|nr:hypothetical protein [Fischerella sp.]
MKAGLKRIEATLQNLGNRGTTAESGDTSKQSLSFRIGASVSEQTANRDTSSQNEHAQDLEPHQKTVETFSVDENACKTPRLPKFKTPSFTSHRNGANPALAMNLLEEIQEIVAGWQTELQKIVRQIQDVYLEGPIVNGWLESYT